MEPLNPEWRRIKTLTRKQAVTATPGKPLWLLSATLNNKSPRPYYYNSSENVWVRVGVEHPIELEFSELLNCENSYCFAYIDSLEAELVRLREENADLRRQLAEAESKTQAPPLAALQPAAPKVVQILHTAETPTQFSYLWALYSDGVIFFRRFGVESPWVRYEELPDRSPSPK